MKKIFKLFLLVIMSVLLIGCKKKETYETFEEQHLSVKSAFKQPYEEYYLYFYDDNCINCINIEKIIFAQAKNEEMPLYFINYKDVVGILNRTNDPKYDNFGALKFSDIKIYGFPTLFLLQKSRVIAQFIGTTEITKELKP